MSHRLRLALMPLFLAASTALADDPKPGVRTLTGKDALGDFSTDAPGVRRKITVDDLATPYDTPSAMNFPRVTPRPEGAWPKAPEGFEVTEFAKGLQEPRVIVRAPNGDLFLSESRANRIRVLRDADGDGKPEVNEVFATGLDGRSGSPFIRSGPSRSTSTSATPTPWSASPTRTATRRPRARPRRSSRTSPAATNASAAAATGHATWSSRPTARRSTSRSDRGRTSTTTPARIAVR